MTDSPSDAAEETTQNEPLAEFAAAMADTVGATDWSADNRTVRLRVERSDWVGAVQKAVDAGMDFFSFLSAIDWANEVEVGDGVQADSVDERYELICRLSTTTSADAIHLVTDLPKDDASVQTLTTIFGGASWHEREAAEMFGIDFVGHGDLKKLYLPDEFEGHPLRKSFPLLTREIKPWPGTVDVEDKPSTSNAEADAGAVQ